MGELLIINKPKIHLDHLHFTISSSCLGFANEDLGRTSTSSTSMLVADEAYAGQAGPATAATGKGLVQDGCWRDTFFSFFSLCPLYWYCGYLQRVRWPDGLCATRSCDQLLVLPTDGDRYSKGLLQRVFLVVPLSWCTDVAVSIGQFPIQHDLR